MERDGKLSSKTISSSREGDDLKYAVQVTCAILQIIGVWPISKTASNMQKIAIRLLNVFCYLLFAFILLPGLLLVFLREHNTQRRVRVLGPLLTCSLSCIKYSLLVYRSKEIQVCLEQVQQDWQEIGDVYDRKVMLSKAKMGRELAIFSAMFMYIGTLSYRTIVPLSKGRMLTPMNTTVRALACPSYFIKFDAQVSPAYEIVFTLQFFAGLVAYSVTCGAAALTAFFIMHVCGQLALLIGKFQHLNDISVSEDGAVATLFAHIVEHQIKIWSFLKQVEGAMQYIWLIEIGGSTLMLCLAGYYIIMDWEGGDHTACLTVVVMLISFIFSIFTVCYVGQLLTDQSIEVGLATSTTNWYRLPSKRVCDLILIMAISNIPSKILAGGLIEVSLPTFGSIVKTSMAYFNMLQKFA